MSCPTPDCPTTGLVLYDTSANVTYGNTALLTLQHRVDPSIFVFAPEVLYNA